MNMISTGAFQTEMDASNKQPTLAEKFAAVWEKKNAKAARAGGVSLMALSLAACGSDDDDGGSSSSGDTSSTSGTTTVMTVSPESVSASADISAPRDYTPGGNDLVNTLQTDDTITGVAGTAQTLTVTFGNNNDAGAATIAPTVSNVETITFNNVSSNAAADTLDMSNISGATTINVSSLSDDTIIRGMDDTSIALTAKNVSDEAADVAFEFDTDATGMTGTATTVDLSIDNFNGAQISLGAGAAAATAGTGVEIVTLTSSGKASTVASLAATGVTDINATATADTTITTVSTTALDTVTMTSSAGVTTSIDVVDNVNANAAFHYTGGAGDDTLRINDGFQGGAVEAADDLRGGEGTDALRVDVDTAGTTVGALDENSAAVVTGFESVMLSQEANAGTTTTDMDFFSGATSLDLRTVVGANTFTINDISDAQAGDIDLTVTAAAGAAATTVNLDLKDGWGTTALATAETVDIDATLGLDAQTLTINDVNNNVESLNLEINSFSTTVTADASAFQTSYTISGGGAGETLAFGAALSNTTVDMAGVSSDITVTTNGTTQTLTAGSGDDAITLNAGIKTIDAGSGGDTVTTTVAGLGTTAATQDTVDGGAGTDTLAFSEIDTLTAAMLGGVSNFERLSFDEAAATATNINMSLFEGTNVISRITVDDTNDALLTFSNVGATFSDLRIVDNTDNDTEIALTRKVDTTGDSIVVRIPGGASLQDLVLNDEETITITSTGGAATIATLTDLDVTDLTSLYITGTAEVAASDISASALALVDASAATGDDVTISAANTTVSVTALGNANGGGIFNFTGGILADNITGGSGADVLVGGTGNDTISGGASGDSITGGFGADTMTGGGGADTFVMTDTHGVTATAVIDASTGNAMAATVTFAVGDTITYGNGIDVITDFTAGAGGDVANTFVAGAATTLVGVAHDQLNAADDINFLSGSWNTSSKVFTIMADGTGADTLIVSIDESVAESIDNTANAFILVGVDSDDLVAANFT